MPHGSLAYSRASSRMAVRRKVHALKRLEAAHAMHMTADPLHSRPSRHARAKMEKHVLTDEFGTISISGGSSSIVEQRNEYRCFRVLPPAGLDVYQDLEHVGVSQAKLGHLDCGQMFDEVCTIRSKCRLIARIIEPYQNGYVVKVNEFGWPTCEQVLEKVGDEWRPLTRPVRQYMMAHIERSKVGATWRRRVVSDRGPRQARTSAEASVRAVSVGKEGREEREPGAPALRCTPTLVSSTDVDEGNPTKISSIARRPYSPSMISELTSSSLTVQREPASYVVHSRPMGSERSSSSDPGQHASPSPARRSKASSFARQSTSSMSLDHSPQKERARASLSGADLSTSPLIADRFHSQSIAARSKSPSIADRSKSPSIADRSKSPSIADHTKSPSIADRPTVPPIADRLKSPSSASQPRTPTLKSCVAGELEKATRMSSHCEQVGSSSQQRSLPMVVPLQLV